MPVIREWNIGDHGRAAIWKVEEPESFFREYTGLDAVIKNEKRRTEHLAGRYLLKYLEQDFPLSDIRKDEYDKPRIDNNRIYFSISHSWPFVAAVVNRFEEAGIDIQTWHASIGRIQHKFLSAREQQLTHDDEQLITAAWCAKEAVYKWNGKRGVDFIEHMPILSVSQDRLNTYIVIYFKLSNLPLKIFVEGVITTDFACFYIESVENSYK